MIALERPLEERAAFLDQSCAGDESLRRDVNALLDSPATAHRFLDRDALEVAAGLVSVSKMPGLSGWRLGVYQLQERIGSGGMGEVYRAHDTRLGRDVAIKILPHGLSADSNRLSRFEREARVLAALNHPNIGAVYGFEEGVTESGETVRGIILELIDGETLSERVRRRPLPIGEALVIAKQTADALDVAHEKGIIHRDLKPANIKIAPDGVVKVLDFGLAKTIADNAAFQSVVPGNTVEGAILGTAAYMSPEQARGQSVDKRTDIWAFGCVLYEMLTGRRAFVGDSLTDTLAHVPVSLGFPAPGLPKGHVVMGYDEHGRCPMLGDDGCTIYEHRPRTCRTYDCRVFAATGVGPDASQPAIAARVRRWRFSNGTADDRRLHDEIRAAVPSDGLPLERALRALNSRRTPPGAPSPA